MDTNSESEDPSTPLLPPPPPVDEDDDDDLDLEDPFEILARTTPSPDSVPWEQRSTKMKIVHVADRIFLVFLALFLLVLAGEVTYVVYHIMPWWGMLLYFKNLLLMQEEAEEDYEL